jgi:hypothetical protein
VDRTKKRMDTISSPPRTSVQFGTASNERTHGRFKRKKEHNVTSYYVFPAKKAYHVLLRHDREIVSLVVADRDHRQKVQMINPAGVVHIRVPLFL